MNFLDGTWLLLPVYMIFFLDNEMTLTEIGLLFGVCSLTQFLFEIPSSVWADKYSRRSVLIVYGIFHVLINVIYLFSSGSFEFFLVAMIFSGIGNALVSGTFSAIIYDTVLSLGREKEYEKIQSVVNRSEFLGKISASLLGAILYFISPKLLFVCMIFIHGFYALLAYTLQEPSVEKSISTSWAQVKEGIRFLQKNAAMWYLILIFSLMVATASISFDYYQPIFKNMGISTFYLGALYIFINVLGFWGAGLYLKLTKKADWKKIMEIYLLIDIASALLLGYGSLLSVGLAVIFLSLSFGAQNIYIGNIIHQSVPSSHRATALSIQSQMNMIFYFVAMIAVSFFADHYSVAWGMIMNAAIVAVLFLVFLKIYGKAKMESVFYINNTAK